MRSVVMRMFLPKLALKPEQAINHQSQRREHMFPVLHLGD